MAECRCIVASRSAMWLLLVFASFGLCLTGFLSPDWLLGTTSGDILRTHPTPGNSREMGREQKIGPMKKCSARQLDSVVVCLFLTWDALESASWKASVVLQGGGTFVVFVALLLGIVSFWKQNIGRFNIISIAGLVEGLAVPLLAAGLAVYPLSWSSESVRRICGESAGDYDAGDCSFQWAFYAMTGGALLTLVGCLLSPRAAKACNSHLVEEKIQLGHSCICVM